MTGLRLMGVAVAVPILCGVLAFGQGALRVDEASVFAHIDHRVAPVYPPLAKIAHIQGTVVFAIQINPDGRIASMHVVSGPAMLQQSAIDCLKQWTFHPYLKDGAAAAVTGTISIPFALSDYHPGPNDELIAERYFPLFDKCMNALNAHQDYAAAESVCNQAAETAEQFGQEVRFIEKRSAFVYASSASVRNEDYPKALDWAEKAVAVVRLGHDDNSGESAAYSALGTVEGLIFDLTDADRDLTTAEGYQLKAIAWAKQVKFEHEDSYTKAMAGELRMHAQVLTAMGRDAEAQEKLDEAAKYE